MAFFCSLWLTSAMVVRPTPISLNIIQWNSGGASTLQLLSARDADVIVLQETKSIRTPKTLLDIFQSTSIHILPRT